MVLPVSINPQVVGVSTVAVLAGLALLVQVVLQEELLSLAVPVEVVVLHLVQRVQVVHPSLAVLVEPAP